MATSHLEKLCFLSLEQVQNVFETSLDSLFGLITNDAELLSPETIKNAVQYQLWFALEDLYETELPQYMRVPEVTPPLGDTGNATAKV